MGRGRYRDFPGKGWSFLPGDGLWTHKVQIDFNFRLCLSYTIISFSVCINPLVKKFCPCLCSLCIHIVVTEGVKWQDEGESSCLLLSPGKRRPPIKRTTALQRGQMVMAPPEWSQQQGWQMVPSLQKISGMSVQTRGDKVFGATMQLGLVNVLQMAVQKGISSLWHWPIFMV